MKKSFKRFLSSVLATIMAVAGMSIGMSTTVMAELYSDSDNTAVWTGESELTVAPATISTVVGTANATGTAYGIVFNNIKASSSQIDLYRDTTSYIEITPSFEVTLTTKVKNKAITMTASNGDADVTMPSDSTEANYTLKANVTYTLKNSATSGSGRAYLLDGFKLTKAGSLKTYTITGSVSGLTAGTKFNLSDGTNTYEATVNDDGSTYTVSQTSAFDATKTYTASKTDYSVSYATGASIGLTVDASDNTKYTASPAITFTAADLIALPEGTYTNVSGGKPNFDVSGLTGTNPKYTGTLKFILSDTATVTVKGICGSTTSGRSVTVAIAGINSYTVNAGDAEASYDFINVPAGETALTFTSDDTTFQLTSITITYGAVVETTYTWVLDKTQLTIPLTGTLALANDTTTNTTSNTLTYEGTDYTLNADYATVTGEPSADNVITVTPEDSWFSEVILAGVITDKATLTFDGVDGSKLTSEDLTVGDFTILADSSSGIETNKSVDFDGLGNYTVRYKTGGKTTLSNSVPSNRAIKFQTAGAGVAQIALVPTGSGSRNLKVYDSTGATVGDGITTADTAAHILTVTLPKADTYYIASPDNGYAIYSVNVVVGDCLDTTTSTYADTVDAYAIAKVATADTTAAKIVVTMNGQSVEDTVVYKAALIDGQYITAEELGADYIYVVKAVNAVANGAIDAVKAFTVAFN